MRSEKSRYDRFPKVLNIQPSLYSANAVAIIVRTDSKDVFHRQTINPVILNRQATQDKMRRLAPLVLLFQVLG
jgi:hypothetical protein